MDIQSVLKVSNCHITIRDAAILREVTFEVKQGRITALVGHNGAGKSSLMKAIIGSIEKKEGTIIIDGIDQDEHVSDYKYQFSYIPEEPLLLNELTIFQHFQLYQKSYDIPDPLFIERIHTYAEAFELMDKLDDYPEELSKGMRQKAQTICALLPDVPLLLIDEPFMGLDVYAGTYLQQLLKQRRDEGTSILLTTHQLDKVHDLADDFVMLKDGRVSSAGAIEQFEQLDRRGSL
ncbi:multidrug ABC transporter ATP-binding protein [Halobacillus andaensis]|uniref:Multidrug ABC transporter ATP-binding protein n=1 Tax=Halobacillus andaensis TaxID=1176239 RepID=A0A917B2J3_HALAA|nr:ABC transporter ATP-binding protein [Halobacillus andaensis]MBP2004741.1 ABC-2 type transport system ATP-binding protein [Halobacillus andaensis]GGF19315.1 multidrug ABC transporter ATP-binding protein [Halobacillus andaensis]